MKRILLSLFAILLIVLVGCGESAPSAPTSELTEPSEQPVSAPEPTPAEFTLNNLQVEIGEREQGSSAYTCNVSVDIQNTGGSKGIYELESKVDGESEDIIEVELDPSENKTIVLLKAEMEIRYLRLMYERGREEIGRTHVVSVGDLSKSITFPEFEPAPEAELEIALSSDFSNPYMGKVFVKLTNSGDAPATDIEIKVEFLDIDDNIIGIEELETWQTESIIMPGKSESFEVTTFSEKVINNLDSYHAYVKWNSIN